MLGTAYLQILERGTENVDDADLFGHVGEVGLTSKGLIGMETTAEAD